MKVMITCAHVTMYLRSRTGIKPLRKMIYYFTTRRENRQKTHSNEHYQFVDNVSMSSLFPLIIRNKIILSFQLYKMNRIHYKTGKIEQVMKFSKGNKYCYFSLKDLINRKYMFCHNGMSVFKIQHPLLTSHIFLIIM